MIDNKIAKDFVFLVANLFGLKKDEVQYEIQDDWKFILVSFELPAGMEIPQLNNNLKLVQYQADKYIPTRESEYSWMINVMRHGAVFESIFGGNLSSPHSGEI
jgi:hypothetical protein